MLGTLAMQYKKKVTQSQIKNFANAACKQMNAAALGLTCKEAMFVFSQNETLRLQTRVQQLEKELHVIKKMYLRQLGRIEWASDVMWEHGIRCGCDYGDCDTCGKEQTSCSCQIRTCKCKECKDDEDHWCNVQVDNGLMPFKGKCNVRWEGGAQRYAEVYEEEDKGPYCGFCVCDPKWYETMNVLRDDTHNEFIDVTVRV